MQRSGFMKILLSKFYRLFSSTFVLLLGTLLIESAHGQVFVANRIDGTIGEYTTSGATINASLISGLNGPIALALDADGNLFVANGDGTIGEYTTLGGVVNASLISGFSGPDPIDGLALDGIGDLFVANNEVDPKNWTTG